MTATEVVTLEYVAAALDVTPYRVLALINAGVLEATASGNRLMIRKSELERYLAYWKASQPRSNP